MDDTIATMARSSKNSGSTPSGKGPRKRSGEADESKTPRYPSRDKVKYAGIPSEYWDLLESLTLDGEKYEGRSVSFLTKIAVRAFLQVEGKLEKGKQA